jgi:cell cycle checkpoint protein
MYAGGSAKPLTEDRLRDSGNIGYCIIISSIPSFRISHKRLYIQRILALTGPAGSAKTATIRLLAQEFGIEILEWRNAVGEDFTQYGGKWSLGCNDSSTQVSWVLSPVSYESVMDKFKEFLKRALTCQSIFGSNVSTISSSQTMSQNSAASQPSKASSGMVARGHIILLEDLPNVLHAPTQDSFHSALSSFVLSEMVQPIPIVIILSDAGVHGEHGNDNEFGGSGGFWKRNKDVIDIRTVIPKSLFGGPYVTQIE